MINKYGILFFFIKYFFDREKWTKVTKIGIDETSSKKGHNYITTFIDMSTKRVIFATVEKNSDTITKFVTEMTNHDAIPEQITEITMDMSPAFILGANTHFINASITFDKFHVMKHLNDAVDATRKTETKKNPLLKGTRYLWLSSPEKLTDAQKVLLKTLTKENTKTAKAYQMKLTFKDIYDNAINKEIAKMAIKKWLNWAVRSKNDSIKYFARMIKTHVDGILRYWDFNLTNAIVEAINSNIQEVKRRAKGYSNIDNFISMIYFVCGNLPLDDIKNVKIDEKRSYRPHNTEEWQPKAFFFTGK
jgi:transposase